MDSAFRGMGIRQLAGLLRARKVSSLELTRDYLGALETTGQRLNAVAELTRDLAEAQARLADKELARRGNTGPLTGIPYGAKDVLATKGIPTRWGSHAYADQVFDYDATVIERLRDARTVLIAKLAMVELAGAGGYRLASASITGPCRNPWNEGHWAGGSSSGSAAAVAAGIVPFSLGSETGGSIVIPSAFCGITGFRPSYGTVSRHGVQGVCWSMDKIGPMARSADDCELVFSAISGRDDRDLTTVPFRYRRRHRATTRIGVVSMDLGDVPETARAFDEAVATFGRLGMSVRAVQLPDFDYEGIFQDLFAAECATALRDLLASPKFDLIIDEQQRRDLRGYASRPTAEYVIALERRRGVVQAIRGLFRDVDVLVMPNVAAEASTIDEDLVVWRTRPHYAILGALAGLPGVSVPMGMGPQGLPLGLSIDADRFQDSTVLDVAKEYQKATDWHSALPPLA